MTIALEDDCVAKSLARAVVKWKSGAAAGEIEEAAFDPPPGKSRAAGIVLVDAAGHVTIREPANHYGGYKWSYAKGTIDPGETPQQAAHRELKEETGLTGRILALIGDFEGDTGVTRFYVGVRDGGKETTGPETSAVKTVSPLTAMGMLNKQRDRDVLARLIELARGRSQSSPVVLSDRFEQALQFAAATHRTQVRKGSGIPYIGHLLGVCSLVIEDGGSEDEAIGALLHDAAEDQGGQAMLDQIEARFGPDVTEIVEGCTDTIDDPKPPWQERKQAYIEHLGGQSDSVLRVSLADKLFNARAIRRDYQAHGEELWARFKTGREGQLWYYRELADKFMELLPDARMAKELSEVVAELERVVTTD